eukprot:TRINITY_DN3254_c0_g1_i1.p1 TRINITY_DN3254_c0_g1~~TRINITY_DN3254_c0_g1_i1.p1  ORF type:complete len:980 (+),score=150.37 TRINITY_DN3254_c0_g1_i1:95-3034(+)
MIKFATAWLVSFGLRCGLALRDAAEAGSLEVEEVGDGIGRSLMRLHHVGTPEEPCQSEECIQSAAWLDPFINRSVDPCEDFSAFTCSARAKKGLMEYCSTCSSQDAFSNMTSKTMTEVSQIITELVDPDASADKFLGPTLAPLVRGAKLAYQACNAPRRGWHNSTKLWEDMDTEVLPILQDYAKRQPGERLEDLLLNAGMADEITRAQRMYGFAGIHVNPFFGVFVGLDTQVPSAGQKVLMLPHICSEYKQMSNDSYNLAAKVWCSLKRKSKNSQWNGSVEDCAKNIFQEFWDTLPEMTDPCAPQLVSAVRDSRHGGMGSHASVGIGAGAAPIYIHELQDFLNQASSVSSGSESGGGSSGSGSGSGWGSGLGSGSGSGSGLDPASRSSDYSGWGIGSGSGSALGSGSGPGSGWGSGLGSGSGSGSGLILANRNVAYSGSGVGSGSGSGSGSGWGSGSGSGSDADTGSGLGVDSDSGSGLGFNLKLVFELLGVPEGVQVYVPGGRRALEAWGRRVATFFVDADRARNVLDFVRTAVLLDALITHGSQSYDQCSHKIHEMFPWLVARKFATAAMSLEKRAEAAEVAWQLVAAFADNLDRLPWISAQTQKRAKEKLRHIDIKTGYPDWIFHDHQLIRRYGYALEFTQGMTWVEITQASGYKNFARMAEQVAIPTNSHSFWVATPDTMNMMYEALTNDVALLAAFMQEPFFSTSTPMSFNFGFTGAVIGHELSHGFDSGGAERGPTGDIIDWWDDSSREQFESRKACFVKQYGTYPLFGDDVTTGATLHQPIGVVEKSHQMDCSNSWKQDGNHTVHSCAKSCGNFSHFNYSSYSQECVCTNCFLNESLGWRSSPYTLYKIVEALFDDGQKCLTENIADSGGLGLAHIAYKKWQEKHGEEPPLAGLEEYTADQLFFMRWGAGWCDVATSAALQKQFESPDTHSTNRLRVVGSVQNSRSFARAFNCPAGAPMSPVSRCEMWGIEA